MSGNSGGAVWKTGHSAKAMVGRQSSIVGYNWGMNVNFYATFRQVVGQKTIQMELPPGATVDDLVSAVIERYPKLRHELLDKDGQLYGHVHVFVNGRDAPYLDESVQTVVQPDDKIDIFPAVAGG